MAENQRRLRQRTAEVTRALEREQGMPRRHAAGDPLDVLIKTVLSQSTSDGNRDLAYGRLRQRFLSWREAMEAPREEVADAIRPAGLHRQKSERIQEILRWVNSTYGELSLRSLCGMPAGEAFETLTKLKGIGVKTAAVVLMIACGRDLFPVDTHVHRIARRLGLVPESAAAVKTFRLMAPLVPEGKAYSLHMNLLELGRTVCTARRPRCAECYLYDLCRWPEKLPKE